MDDKPRIFISHSHQDNEFVHKLANDLAANGIKSWVDDWEIKVGDSLIQKISEGIRQSDFIIAVLSKNSLRSKWVQKELDIAFQKNPVDAKRVFIPVLLGKVELPSYLRDLKYIDLSESYQEGINKIVQAIAEQPPQEKPSPSQLIDVNGLAKEVAKEVAHILKVNPQGVRMDNGLSKSDTKPLNKEDRPWYKDPKIIIPAAVVIIAALINPTWAFLLNNFKVSSSQPSFSPTPTPQTLLINSPTPTPLNNHTSVEKQVEEVAFVRRGETERLFNGNLSISLISTSFEGYPLRDKVFAIIGSPNHPNLEIEGKDVGYVTIYNGSNTFEIRITKVDTFWAEFNVRLI